MDVLTIVTYCWGAKYPELYVKRLAAGVKRNLAQPYQFVCVTDCKRPPIAGVRYVRMPAEDEHLTKVKGCFARLRLFDPAFQQSIGADDRIVNMDLDAVVTGPLDALFEESASFRCLRGINTTNPLPSNGSLWMVAAGHHQNVWKQFSVEAAARIPYHSFPDDQAWFDHMLPWFHHALPGTKSSDYGPHCGVYGFRKKGWCMRDGSHAGESLPENARFVAFPGWRDPSKFTDLPWVKEHWRA